MKRNQSTALVRLFSSSLRLGLALGVVGVFASVGSAASASKDTYYVNDHLASTVATSDAVGEIAQIESDAFGTQAGAVAKDSRFTGKPYDADMGAYVFPFRNYRSDEARWMSADPSGFPDGVNASRYNPLVTSQFDPTGLALSDLVNGGPFDQAGATIWDDWVTGNGSSQIYDEVGDPAMGVWGDYMRANSAMNSHIVTNIFNDAQSRTTSGLFTKRDHAQLEDGYYTGYQCLHGSNPTVGDFFLSANASVGSLSEGGHLYRTVSYTNAFGLWNDIIDPELSAGALDQIGALLGAVSPYGNDYTIRIKWNFSGDPNAPAASAAHTLNFRILVE